MSASAVAKMMTSVEKLSLSIPVILYLNHRNDIHSQI